MARSASNESTWRPKAFRRTTMSMPPMVCWSGRPPSSRSASMIMPAHEPYMGSPDARASRSGSISPKSTASLLIVVDSPPGITSASTCASSSGVRTRDVRTPHSLQHLLVLAHVTLQGEHSDQRGVSGEDESRARHQPRPAYRSDSGSVSMLMPTIASPSPRDTLAMTSGLS